MINKGRRAPEWIKRLENPIWDDVNTSVFFAIPRETVIFFVDLIYYPNYPLPSTHLRCCILFLSHRSQKAVSCRALNHPLPPVYVGERERDGISHKRSKCINIYYEYWINGFVKSVLSSGRVKRRVAAKCISQKLWSASQTLIDKDCKKVLKNCQNIMWVMILRVSFEIPWLWCSTVLVNLFCYNNFIYI